MISSNKNMGINPALNNIQIHKNGAKVLILEHDAENGLHAGMVEENASRAVPGTNFSRKNGNVRLLEGKPGSGLKQDIQRTYLNYFKDNTKWFQEIAKLQGNERPDAVNISQGLSELSLLNIYMDNPETTELMTNTEKAELVQEVLLPPMPGSKLPASNQPITMINLIKLEAYIDESLEEIKPELDKAKKDLKKEVQNLKELRIPIITAIGNDNELLLNLKLAGLDIEEDEGIDRIADTGPISVGATSRNGKLTDYSTRSKHVSFGLEVAYGDQGDAGTSFTSPYLAALIGKYLKENPDKSVADAIEHFTNKGRTMKDDQGNTYTNLDVISLYGKLDMPKGKKAKDRPSTIQQNKALENWLEQQQNSGRNAET